METDFRKFPEMRPAACWTDREARALVKFVARGGASVSPDNRPDAYLIFDPLDVEETLYAVDKIVRCGRAENPLEYLFDPVARVVYHERTWTVLCWEDDVETELMQIVAAGSSETERRIAQLRSQFREMPDEVYRRLLPMRDFFLSMTADVIGRRDD